jgi:hypothetical protein
MHQNAHNMEILRMKKWGDDVAVCFDFYESILFEIQFV